MNAHVPITVHREPADPPATPSTRGSQDDQITVTRGLTPRAVLAGLAIGVLINLSNTYYGLRIGVASQMSMVSSLLGFAGFKLISRYTTVPFLPAENVLLVSVATATGAMPVTAGFVGVIPALEYLIGPEDNGPLVMPWQKLALWSVALCFFGLIFAAWLRPHFIERQNLPWPGARATANLISTLHHKAPVPTPTLPGPCASGSNVQSEQHTLSYGHGPSEENQPLFSRASSIDWNSAVNWLIKGASMSGLLTIVMFFIPILHNVPIFGKPAAKDWLWSIDLSPGFFGQGIITGPTIPIHMLVGAIVGWGILSPYAKSKGYAPGKVDDWENGPRGWIIWVSLAALLADASVKLGWFILKPAHTVYCQRDGQVRTKLRSLRRDIEMRLGFESREPAYHVVSTEDDDSPTVDGRNISGMHVTKDEQEASEMSLSWSVLGLILFVAIVACVLAMQVMFGMIRWYYTMLAIFLSLPMAVVGIRSLAETDYNPESAIVSQLVFASIISQSNPNGIIINLLSAAVAQAGANQSGDLSYDFKVGHLVGARPDIQTWGQIIGSIVGAFVSCSIYRLYASQYTIPGPLFRVPSSFLVLSTARLLMGRGLPEGVAPFALGAAILSAAGTVVKMRYSGQWWEKFLPSGVAFAIGIYNTPSFTITRAIGGLLYLVHKRRNGGQAGHSVIFASGLLLGESLASLVTIALTAAKVSQLGGD
ncbi:oligopeptide transporter [Metarhizium guizhouense ARSEF 977]|uniref:Oligopeptide transporter n=1 Tax=Metarhizium guizhouense (strain ARSEF 977) TaxID=1276136 RepID=A0A0B4GA40_METGA|nr:oligopeptide transporter [Metarhizium guizhouense ARSEF 977]